MSTVFRSTNPFHELPIGLRSLLIANVVIFMLQIALPFSFLERYLALHPLQSGQPFWPWQLVTYSFLHGGGFHLFINMWILWMFGNPLESALGTKTFLSYYFLCVLGAGLTHFFLVPGESAVGASGGIYGLLIAFGLLFPDSIMYLFFVLPMKAIHAVLFIAFLALASAMNSGGSRIAHIAHLGGMATGFLYFKLPVWFQRFRFRRRSSPKFHVIQGDRRTDFVDDNSNQLKIEVDRILEKISSRGLQSLTEKEHETMRNYAKSKS